jgi:hypothetical protein
VVNSVLRTAKAMHHRAKFYSARAARCGGKKYTELRQSADLLLEQVKAERKVLLQPVKRCEGQPCPIGNTKQATKRLNQLAKKLLNSSHNAQIHAIIDCKTPRTKGPRQKDSSSYYDDMRNEIKKMPNCTVGCTRK